MESKKRPHDDDDDTLIAKKRVLEDVNGSPHVNGVSSEREEPISPAELELFRKEAIYRRMKYHSRENERSQSRIAELEHRKNTCEAGLAAISACWAQLVETIKLFVKPDELPEVEVNSRDLFDLSASLKDDSTPELTKALGETMTATQSLVTKFVQMDSGSRTQSWQSNASVHKAQSECVALQSQIDVMRSRLKDCESQRDKYRLDLIAAENRVERSQSAMLLELQSRASKGKVQKKKDEQGERVEIKTEPEEIERKPSSPAHPIVPPVEAGESQSEIHILAELVKHREAKIVELEHEAAVLRDEKTLLELELKSPSVKNVSENPYYKALLSHASVLEATVADNKEHIARLSDELRQLQSLRMTWEAGIKAEAARTIEELQGLLTKRDVDNTRLRDQRDRQLAELNERKLKDSVKLQSHQEVKLLADTRLERLNQLISENKRYKAQLAANAEQLKEQTSNAENRVAALEQTFSIYQDDHPDVVQHMKAEADALQKLAEVTAQLERYRKVYGDVSSLSPDVSRLVEQLKLKDSENEKLRLLQVERSESEAPLYSELEKLSTAWESLDKQVASKIFDLSSIEDRCTKLTNDRAKMEHKYFASLREKEASDAERKNLYKSIEKQGKGVECLVETERKLNTQINSLEKEIFALQKSVEQERARCEKAERDNVALNAQMEADKFRLAEVRMVLSEREKAVTQKRAELRQQEDNWIRAMKDVERQASQLKTSTNGPQKKQNSDDQESNHLRTLLKCSTCGINFREVLLLKCSHTFCKPCVEARITTRQRKCPHCNLLFAQSDVQPLYLQ